MKALFALILVTGLTLQFAAGQALAIVTVPSDLNIGDQYRLVFVTSTNISATSSNISDYNAHAQSAASAVTQLNALFTTWNALASTGTVDARDNTFSNYTTDVGYPIYRLKLEKLQDLLPGEAPGLDTICDGILGKGPFVLQS